MRLLLALGGNALLRRGEPLSAETQRRNIRKAVQALAPLAGEHQLIITHGNGPQVGLLALQSASCQNAMPLDVLGAESEGMIGYMITQELMTALPGRAVATLLTQTLVDPDDPAFTKPTKPIGSVYDEEAARRLAKERGWSVGPDGPSYRRIVPSPMPLAVLEEKVIRLLLQQDVIVVCAGGGGIPVIREKGGAFRGVEAVVDKDRTSAVLADALGMDALLILTDVDAVYSGWGTDHAQRIPAIRAQDTTVEFPAGSMGPKVEAAKAFAKSVGRFAAIGNLNDVAGMLNGTAGTRVTL
ncbi:MAG: carbamate kinase [Rhodospirillaceae bacterium]|nr:MAG: carbamate kinase [Rhodospirillaceae bacterium]